MSRPYWLYPLNYKDDADSARKRRDQVAFAARGMIESDHLFALRSLHDGTSDRDNPKAYALTKGLGGGLRRHSLNSRPDCHRMSVRTAGKEIFNGARPCRDEVVKIIPDASDVS